MTHSISPNALLKIMEMVAEPGLMTAIGDVSIDPKTMTMNMLTGDGIKKVDIGTPSTSVTAFPRVVEDNRPTIAEKPLAVQVVSVSDFERLSHNASGHMIRLITNAGERLRRTVQADTRCGDCQHVRIKVEQQEDLMRAETRHILMTECGVRQPGMTGLVCPDGRATGVSRELPILDATAYTPEVTPKADPDKPSTTFEETW